MGMKLQRPAGRPTITIEGHELDEQDLVDEVEEALERVLEERMEEGDDFAKYEKTLMKVARNLVRSKLEKKLQAMSDQLAKRLWIDHDNPVWPLDETGTKFQYRTHQNERFDAFWYFFTHYYRARAIIPTIGA